MDVQPDLIKLCIKGDRKAEYTLYKACFSYLMSICIRYTRNEEKARENLNMGFYKILSNLNTYDDTVPFKPWVRKIMINQLINEYKKEKIHYGNMLYVENYLDTDGFSELNKAISKMNTDRIYEFIARLPAASQQVFNLYYVDGYKHREIADMLGISDGTSKWHLNFAREKLKEMLRESNVHV